MDFLSSEDAIRALQSFESGLLDAFFNGVTLLGNYKFYLLLIPLIYWCWDKKFGFRISVLLMLSFYLNITLKSTFDASRPDKSLWKTDASNSSFPSGHAQNSATFWSYLALIEKRKLLIALSVALVSLVAVSRVYLGVHFPRDVVFGAFIGIALALLFFVFEPFVSAKVMSLSVKKCLLVSFPIPLVMFTLFMSQDSSKICGMLLGLLLGYILESNFVNMQTYVRLRTKVLRYTAGISILLLTLYSVESFIAMNTFSYFFLYYILGMMLTFAIPLLFVKVERRFLL